MDKIYKEEFIGSFSPHDVEGTYEEAIKIFKEFKDAGEAKGLINMAFKVEGWDISAVGYRLETDKEFNKRKRRLEINKRSSRKRKETNKQKRLDLFNKLKKEFE